MGNSAGRDVRKMDRAEMQREALRLRRNRNSYDAIARELNISKATAFRLVQDGIAAIPKDDATATLAIELEDLDALERPQREKALRGDPHAAELILRIKARRAKYLGLDAPSKQEVSGPDGGPIHLATDVRHALLDRLSRLADAAAKGRGGSSPDGG